MYGLVLPFIANLGLGEFGWSDPWQGTFAAAMLQSLSSQPVPARLL
jgi:hypothetical protein